MPSRIIDAAKATNGYHFRIHLDTEQIDPETGEPDPAWVQEITFGPLQPSLLPLHENGGHNEKGEFLHACTTQHGKDLTEKQYLANIMAQIPPMVELELHRRRGTSHHERTPLTHLHGKEF